MTGRGGRVINSMKFIAAGHETSRFAFNSYFGRRYHGYLGRITRLVSRAITISGLDNPKKLSEWNFFTPKIYILHCCLLHVKKNYFRFNKNFLKMSVYYFSLIFLRKKFSFFFFMICSILFGYISMIFFSLRLNIYIIRKLFYSGMS